MINNKTVFVIGAGASAEVGLPVGHNLKQIISNKLNFQKDMASDRWISGDPFINEALEIISRQSPSDIHIRDYRDAAKWISEALPMASSIDQFIDTQKDNKSVELCGKLAIVRSILEAERESDLYFEFQSAKNEIDFNSIENTWFAEFWKLLTLDARKEDIPDRLANITFIVFNYDRCLEHYLFGALQKFYRIEHPEAATIVNGMNIYHPYGTVGSLGLGGGNNFIHFGGDPKSQKLLNLAAGIKTFTEGVDEDSSDICNIRSALVDSTMVVFLGFSFNKLNLELLNPNKGRFHNSSEIRYFATALGLSDNACEETKTNLNNMSGISNSLVSLRQDKECAQLFQEYNLVFAH